MSEQTKKVVKVRENIRSYPNKQPASSAKNPTVFIHGITLEGDPQEFEYHSFSQECKNFVAGQDATFTTEVKENGKFTNYKISPVREQKPFGAKAFTKNGDKPQEVITALSCASTAANFYQQRQGTEEEVLKFAERLYQWVSAKKP
jgi:hypothetical protein